MLLDENVTRIMRVRETNGWRVSANHNGFARRIYRNLSEGAAKILAEQWAKEYGLDEITVIE